ncbi:hypothetical protein Vi05172_g4537 [Venturia inaequalis]|uniref:FAD-binding PCMH-type domain-containing protein n=2 Tax=Venturia inaequalis TaxID=5025 RepID=A0A8H3YTL8_VENIN|nr:hypothetical protein EG327_010575 [Venturia inaequalis]RDI85664.1 hypothetical protein Vi05172_g4537 [Venturia inaequalis]
MKSEPRTLRNLAISALVFLPASVSSLLNMTKQIATCSGLDAAGLDVYQPNSTVYVDREASYYSASAIESPWCIVQPKNSAEVSLALKTLLTLGSNWAVRCGGHTAWGASADIHDGVTIDLGVMNKTQYDTSSQVAKIDGGSLWKDVYGELEKYGATAPGGRTSTVGVGGFTLGGGNNFWSGKLGFTCDNVVNFEVVLASGEIVNANKTVNSDLWKALKGGSSNFGIVTRFDVQAFSAGNLYGGMLTFPDSATDQVIAAFVSFTNNIVNYQEGEAITYWSFIKGATESIIINDIQDVSGAVDAPAFKQFKAITPVLSSTLRSASHLNMAVELNFANGNRNVWFAITVKNDASMLKYIVDQHNAFIPAWRNATGDDTFSLYTIFQNLPTVLFDHGVEKGGNVLGMDSVKENSVMFEVIFVFENAALEDQAREALATYRETVKAESVKRGVDVDWEYLNYADKTQNPLSTYGDENVAFMKTVAAKYDPNGIFQTRQPGGFKLSKV